MRQALRIARKELTESFRDRQTLTYAVLMPLLLYPAVFFLLLQGWAFVRARAVAESAAVVVAGAEAVLAEGWEETLRGRADEPGSLELETHAEAWSVERATAHLLERDDSDAVLTFDDSTPPQALLVLNTSRPTASVAEERVRERLATLADQVRARERDELGLTAEDLTPFTVETINLASRRDMGGFLLSFMLPLFFVIMAVSGAFYPAVDMTAGERERRTLETTLSLPVPPLAFAAGKLFATTVLSLFAALLNLLGMALAAGTLLAGMPAGGALSIEVPVGALLRFLPFAVLFAIFTAAVILGAMSWVKTYRQGQSLFGGIQIAFFVPAMVTAMPGLTLTPALAPIPVVGAVLLFKERLQSADSDPLALWIVALSMALYAALAVALALAWTSRNELEGERRGWLSRLVTGGTT